MKSLIQQGDMFQVVPQLYISINMIWNEFTTVLSALSEFKETKPKSLHVLFEF